jgi:hypothetical protein
MADYYDYFDEEYFNEYYDSILDDFYCYGEDNERDFEWSYGTPCPGSKPTSQDWLNWKSFNRELDLIFIPDSDNQPWM